MRSVRVGAVAIACDPVPPADAAVRGVSRASVVATVVAGGGVGATAKGE